MLHEYIFTVLIAGEDFRVRFWDYSQEAAQKECKRCLKDGSILRHI